MCLLNYIKDKFNIKIEIILFDLVIFELDIVELNLKFLRNFLDFIFMFYVSNVIGFILFI